MVGAHLARNKCCTCNIVESNGLTCSGVVSLGRFVPPCPLGGKRLGISSFLGLGSCYTPRCHNHKVRKTVYTCELLGKLSFNGGETVAVVLGNGGPTLGTRLELKDRITFGCCALDL